MTALRDAITAVLDQADLYSGGPDCWQKCTDAMVAAVQPLIEAARAEERVYLMPWLDHRWKCTITRYIRSNEAPDPYTVCDCGFWELVDGKDRARKEQADAAE